MSLQYTHTPNQSFFKSGRGLGDLDLDPGTTFGNIGGGPSTAPKRFMREWVNAGMPHAVSKASLLPSNNDIMPWDRHSVDHSTLSSVSRTSSSQKGEVVLSGGVLTTKEHPGRTRTRSLKLRTAACLMATYTSMAVMHTVAKYMCRGEGVMGACVHRLYSRVKDGRDWSRTMTGTS